MKKTVYIPDDRHSFFKAIAESRNISMNSLILEALDQKYAAKTSTFTKVKHQINTLLAEIEGQPTESLAPKKQATNKKLALFKEWKKERHPSKTDSNSI